MEARHQAMLPASTLSVHIQVLLANRSSSTEEEIEGNLYKEVEEQPIQPMADDCSKPFKEGLALSADSNKKPYPKEFLRLVKEHYRRFNGWRTFSVFLQARILAWTISCDVTLPSKTGLYAYWRF
jgi:hypothetical protein